MTFFGYFGSGHIGGGDGHGAEIADHANVGAAYWNPADVVGSVDAIRANASHGLRVILDVSLLFWHTQWTGGRWTLKIDGARWDALDSALSEANLWQAVAGFYHFDEPFSRTASAGRYGRPKQAVADDLRLVNQFLAQRKPGVFRVVVFSWNALMPGHNAEMAAPSADAFGFDVVGFDCYSDSAPYGDEPSEYLAMLHELKRRCPGKPILLIPDAQMFTTDTPAAKRARIEGIYQLGQSDPQIVGMLAYTWNDRGTGHESVRNIPWMKDLYRTIGQQITGRGIT